MSYDVRKKAYSAGQIAGARDERRRIADQLDEIVGAADLQGKVLALISELQADDTTSRRQAATQTRTPGKVDPAVAIADAQRGPGDLGDRIVEIMRERRGQAGAA